MRYAIVSDIHANLVAWEAVLADLRQLNIEEIVCLGDVVGYGPKPAEVLDAVKSVTGNFVMGNHDAAAVGMMDYSIFNDHAREAIEWTMKELKDPAKEFLSSVPLAIEAGDVLFVHAEIKEPGHFGYIDGIEAALDNFKFGKHFVTFIGHTHLPKTFEMDIDGDVSELADGDMTLDPNSRYIVNVGSVGEPRNPDDLRARYVVYDTDTEELIFRRVEFDIIEYRKHLEATTLSMRPFFLRTYEHVVEGQDVEVSNGGSLMDMKVVQGSASLISSGQVANMGQLMGSHLVLASARPSKAPKIILGVAAAAVVFFLVYLAVNKVDERSGNETLAQNSKEKKEAPAKVKEGEGSAAEPLELPADEVEGVPGSENEIAPVVVESPDPEMEEVLAAKAAEKPKTKPESRPKPKPAPPKPKEVESFVRAWWRMDGESENSPLVDGGRNFPLGLVRKGQKFDPIAPNPIPLNQKENTSSLKIGIWQESEPSGMFGLNAKQSFTFEGWFLAGKIGRAAFLVGTRPVAGGGRGWHIDLRPARRGKSQGQMSFFFDSGQKVSQALADEVQVGDFKPHHFAAVWDHDQGENAGQMRLFLDGVQVADQVVPHAGLSIKQSHPLSVGAKGNPSRLALDELRFSQRALPPHEFLLRPSVSGMRMIKTEKSNRNSWMTKENWEGGKVPEGDENVIIAEGVTAHAENKTPPKFTGSLVLKNKARVILWGDKGLSVIPKSPSKIVMYEDSRFILRTGNAKIGPVEVLAQAEIWGGDSTNGHRGTRQFLAPITGPGKLIINGVNKNTIVFEATNTFTGGFEAYSTQKQEFRVIAKGKGNLGKGDVTIGENCVLTLAKDSGDVIKSDKTLTLKTKEGSKEPRIIMDSSESVGAFFINGEDQGVGEFTSETHEELGGTGKLTVKGIQ